MMLRYIWVLILIGVAFSDAYRRNENQRRREYLKSKSDYGDYDDYFIPVYAKDSEADNTRPSIFTYWNNFLKRTHLPSWNITNPFSKLFTPYVVKVDVPEPNDEPEPQPNRNRRKKPSQQGDYIYLNTYPNTAEPEKGQFFYDPVTQQYYEVQETASQDYNPQNNYYATTFNDQDEIVIDLSNNDKKQESNHDDDIEYASEEEEAVSYSENAKNTGLLGKYNSPAIRKLKTKRFNVRRKATTKTDYR